MSGPAPRVVLFDLGGVLVEIAGARALGLHAGGLDDEAVWRRWLACPWVRRYERGDCTRDEFARGLVGEWGLDLAPEAFLAHFRRFVRCVHPGAESLVRELEGRVRRACLSNTNELHWRHCFEPWGLADWFDASFLSYRMGRVKPDREAFLHVLEALGAAPEEVLFLDDNAINVEGARAVGLEAHRVLGVEEARRVLSARGLLR